MRKRNQTAFTRRITHQLLDSGLTITRVGHNKIKVGFATLLHCERVVEGGGVARMDKLMNGADIAILDGGRVRSSEHTVCMTLDFLIDIFHGTANFPAGGYPTVTGRTGRVIRQTVHGMIYVVAVVNTIWVFMGADTLNRIAVGKV